MPATENKWRFPLPEDWEPEGTICVVFRVPNDSEYVSQIIGLTDALKFSKNFARDPTKTGAATVSRTWQAALESEPVLVLIDCGVEDMAFIKIRHRPKPGAPWITQEKYDDEVEWRDAHIQPHWETTSSVPPADGDFEAAKRQAATIVRGWHEWLATEILGGVEAAESKETTLDRMMGQIAPYTPNPTQTRQKISQAYDALTDLPTPTAEPYQEDCAWLTTWQLLVDKIMDGLMQWGDDFTSIFNSPNDWEQMQAEERFFNSAGAGMMGNDVYHFAQEHLSGDPGEFAITCVWEYTINFEIGQGGFEPGEPVEPCPETEWAEGVGWRQLGPCEELNANVQAIIKRIIRPTDLTEIQMFFGFDDANITNHAVIYLDPENEACRIVLTGAASSFTWNSMSSPSCLPISFVQLEVYNTAGVTCWISSVRFAGTGYNPFM